MQASDPGLSLSLSLQTWSSPPWDVRWKEEWAHHPVHKQHHPRVELPPFKQTRLLGAIREHRICTIPSGWDPSTDVVPGTPWRGSSSESRRHVPGAASLRPALMRLERDLHTTAEQLFAISFQNCQPWPSHLFLIGNPEEKSLRYY